ncbi:unnamed protein product [Rhizoctonia solani]|uniref:Uncharacterized protein n=1 Tax=Rhizoctonia solani TaxID=456999 RepID=A0A8H2XMI9_9AGAM|nr:unnamed protein product [Rhizoctonia solani]
MSLLLSATPYFVFVAICPATCMLFALRMVSEPSGQSISLKAADFYATLLFGVFTTLAGVFGIIAESLSRENARWWTSATFAMQALGILIAQLAVIQLLAPDYLRGLLSIRTSATTLPPWRIYTLILIALVASVASLISAFVVSEAPSLPSSIPTLVSLTLPTPLLFSLARRVRVARSSTDNKSSATTVFAKQNRKCIELGLPTANVNHRPMAIRFPHLWKLVFMLQNIAVLSIAGEVAEGALGHRVPVIRVLSSMGLIAWGGGIMVIHYIIAYKPTHNSPMVSSVNSSSEPSHILERVTDQPSEDFMTLKDPFASPTQAGFPLPPSPPRAVPLRRPRRRASEPLQLRRFGSFAVLTEDVKEKQAGTEEDQDTSLLEDLVRHAWFSTGCADSDSIRNNFHECGRTLSTPAHIEERISIATSASVNGSSIHTTRPELPGVSEAASPSVLVLDSSRPATPPRLAHSSSRTASQGRTLPDPPTPFPFLPMGLVRPISLSASTYPPACISPHSPVSSGSGSSFVSPPPTPTPGPSSQHLPPKALKLTFDQYPRTQAHRPFSP